MVNSYLHKQQQIQTYMKQQYDDNEWEGFEHQPEPNLQKTLQPFALPILSKTPNQPIKKQINLKPIIKQEKHHITEISKIEETIHINKMYPRIPIIRPKNSYYRNNEGILIYQGFEPSYSDRYFTHQKQQKFYQKPKTKDNLSFDSRFQCGNLNRVYKTQDNTYNLYMKVDTNTQGHLQWFYFQIKNQLPQKAVFTIFRFKKKFSLYQRGMKPYIKSKKEKTGWRQAGDNIRYWNIETDSKSKYYALTFQYNFRYDDDQVLIAACPPYSYSLLNSRLQEFAAIDNCTVGSIGETLGGLKLPLVTFGNQDSRTHPGETSSSWVMDGFMTYLASQKSQQLLKRVTFKIIPMGNPDGVVIGNYRTGIIGKDFNRCFHQNFSSLLPQISQLKSLIKNLQKNGKILIFLDLHGHSIQKNSFIFGPEKQVFPSIFQQFISDLSQSSLFKQASCKLKTRSDCTDTARGYFQNIKKIFALTIQNSLGLYETNDYTFPILPDKWRLFGRELAQSIYKAIVNRKQQIVFRSQIKPTTSQLQIINKKIVEKIDKRIFTQKSQVKDQEKDKNTKFLNKKRFEMMRWKKLSQIKNQFAVSNKTSVINVHKKIRKFSQQMGIPEITKQDIQIAQTHTSKNQTRRGKQFREQKRPSTNIAISSEKKIQSPNKNKYSPNKVCSKKLKLQGWEQTKNQIQILLNPSQVQIPQLYMNQEDIEPSSLIQKQFRDQLDKLSDQQSQSSDINDRQSNSDDLQPQQLQSLFQTVEIINKNRIFQFQFEIDGEERRINKLKQVVQKRINKQPSYHSVPQKMQVYNKFNQLKLNLNNKSVGGHKKSLHEQLQTSVLKHRHRKTLYQPIVEMMEANNNLSIELPSLETAIPVITIVGKNHNRERQEIIKKPIVIPSNRVPANNVYRGNLIEQTLKEQLLIQTTKRLQKLHHQSIFSSKPFDDHFVVNKSKSRFADIKKKL